MELGGLWRDPIGIDSVSGMFKRIIYQPLTIYKN